jgi:hypothetical protein
VIIDLRKDTPMNEIAAYVNGLDLGAVNRWFMKFTFKHMLLKRAYTELQMKQLAAQSDFGSCEIIGAPVGMEIRLIRRQPLAEQAA